MKMDYNSSMVKGKKILVVGLANKYSIAAAISSSLFENGATLGFSSRMIGLRNLSMNFLLIMVAILLKFVIYLVIMILKN